MLRTCLAVVGLGLCLACGGVAEPELEEPVLVPVPRMPDPPVIRSSVKGEATIDPAVERRLRVADPLIRSCLAERRPEIRGADEPIAMSAEVRIIRETGGMGVEVVRDGFESLEVVDGCLLTPLKKVDVEGLPSFDVVWQIVADFP